MIVRSYSFHVSHQYTLHVIIIGGETMHRRCLVLGVQLYLAYEDRLIADYYMIHTGQFYNVDQNNDHNNIMQ